MKIPQKMEKKNKGNPKIEDSRKVKTYFFHATFPLDYNSKNGLIQLRMMFKVETRNRNPYGKKHDFRQSAKIKDDIQNAKTTLHNVLIGLLEYE